MPATEIRAGMMLLVRCSKREDSGEFHVIWKLLTNNTKIPSYTTMKASKTKILIKSLLTKHKVLFSNGLLVKCLFSKHR